MKQPVTVVITCVNDPQRLAKCIEHSSSIADEILIAESVERSGTHPIAKQDERIRVVPYKPIRQDDFLNWTIAQASHDWVLLLDADEQITQALTDEIELVLSRGATCDAYTINRDTFVNGKRLEAPNTTNSRRIRLFRTDQVLCVQNGATRKIEIQSGKLGKITNKIRRYPDWRFESAMVTLTSQAAADARQWHENGKTTSWRKLLLVPVYHFVVQYFWRGSIFDGGNGIRLAWQTAFQRFCTHAYLRDLQQDSHAQNATETIDPKTIDLLDPTFRRAA